MKTFSAKPEEIQREWLVIDAAGKSLGRVAAEAARLLRGKHKPIFTPHVDTGDHVIIINAAKVVLTGTNKADERIHWHTGYPGGLKFVTRGQMLLARPDRLVERTVKGMLPHNRLGAQMYRKLKVYAGAGHPHQAQQPRAHDFVGSTSEA